MENVHKNVSESALFFEYKNVTQSVGLFCKKKNVTANALFFALILFTELLIVFHHKNAPPLRQFQKLHGKSLYQSKTYCSHEALTQPSCFLAT